MRAVLHGLTLLVGVAIVAAMAWYGARALFFDEDPIRVIRPAEPSEPAEPVERDCAAATEAAARAAQRTFLRVHVRDGADAAWFSGAGTSSTDVLPGIIEEQEETFDNTVLPVEGEGSFVIVKLVPDASAPDLPDCIGDVPVVVTYGGPVVAY